MGQYSQSLVALSETKIERFLGNIRTTLIFGQLFVVMMIGVLVAGGVASFFYFQGMTLDNTSAALYVMAEFLVLALLSGLVYTIRKR